MLRTCMHRHVCPFCTVLYRFVLYCNACSEEFICSLSLLYYCTRDLAHMCLYCIATC